MAPTTQATMKTVCDDVTVSVVQIIYEPQDTAAISAYMDQTTTKPDKETQAQKRKRERLRDEEVYTKCYFSTGFIVGENTNYLHILTCAHTFKHCFNQANPLMDGKIIENMYRVSVTCDHLETKYLKKTYTERQYIPARVLFVNSEMDLMVIQVKKGCKCTEVHKVLDIAPKLPEPMVEVGMVSWPLFRHRTSCEGLMTHHTRDYSEISEDNPHGYTFTGLEVNITSEPGSSRAPLLNLSKEYLGVLHGGRVECYTYFVSLEDVRTTLANWGVIK